jgi:hypothetical protein
VPHRRATMAGMPADLEPRDVAEALGQDRQRHRYG